MTDLSFLDKPEPTKKPNGKPALIIVILSILGLALVFGSIANASKQVNREMDNTNSNSYVTEAAVDAEAFADSYVYGSWGEKFVRSNGYTYPYMFYSPLYQCGGFTLDYEVSDISEGNLNGNFRFEIYVHTTAGNWKSVKLFSMDGYEKTVQVRFDNRMDIDGVAVVCQKKSNVTFSYNLWVRDPV